MTKELYNTKRKQLMVEAQKLLTISLEGSVG